MQLRALAIGVALMAVCLIPISASTSHFPIDDLEPGMVGTGRTVFAGDRIEDFTVHVLGVVRNVLGPGRNLILARLEGGPLAETGVIAGMSGSPVYIDGRLVGAVSYSLGMFSKEPIAGITPIDEMIEATRLASDRPASAGARLTLPVTPASLQTAMQQALAGTRAFSQTPADVRIAAGAAAALDPSAATTLRPIATPLILGGFQPEVAGIVSSALGGSMVAPVAAAGTGSAPPSTRPLEPGDAVGVSLIDGDLSLGATGTVTDIEGGRVYAFGHPFYNLGPTAFPMTRAYVHTLLPSLMSSSKLSSLGDTIGLFQQDRATAIAGTLGETPSMLPLTIALETERGFKRTFTFRVVRDQLFTPVLTYAAILNTLKSYEREFGASTFEVKGRALVRKHGELSFEDLFTGESPSIGAASYIAGPLTFLLKNEFEPVEIDALDIHIASSEEPRTATVERVWLDTVQVKAGRTVPLKVLIRSYRGEEVTREVPIDIPANASGPLTVMVADGSRLTQWEQREARQPQQAHGVAQMLRAINEARKNNRLYVRLLSTDAGAVVSGEPLSALPPSVLSVLESDRNGGEFVPLRTATIGEWDIPVDYALNGARFLTINVEGAD